MLAVYGAANSHPLGGVDRDFPFIEDGNPKVFLIFLSYFYIINRVVHFLFIAQYKKGYDKFKQNKDFSKP